MITYFKTPHIRKLIEIVLAMVLAVVALELYGLRKVDLMNPCQDVRLGVSAEFQPGQAYTAFSPNTIYDLVQTLKKEKGGSRYILWLGNSQLHTINQKKSGDHLAPYWLGEELNSIHSSEIPLGLSIPSADFQEMLLISRYASVNLPIKILIVPMVFEVFREDGIREELAPLASDNAVIADINKLPARDIVRNSLDEVKSAINNEGTGKNRGQSYQKEIEEKLNGEITKWAPLWGVRDKVRSSFLVDLYYFRNWILGIKSTSIRHAIPVRLERNMVAYDSLLKAAQSDGLKILVYIAPIRQGLPLPYDKAEYANWKAAVEKVAHLYGAKFVNFEKLVPPVVWGEYDRQDVDFMHFQGEGHKILAKAIYSQLEK